MKSIKKVVTLILFIVLIIISSNVVFGEELLVSEPSKAYVEWLELSDEEKKNTIEPPVFSIKYTPSRMSRGFFGKLKAIGKTTILPESYDLRDYIDIEVKDQKNTNSCWAFSSTSAVETYLAKQKEYEWNFSERHLEYATASNFTDGTNPGAIDREVASGGNSYFAVTYYSRGDGPILEKDMPFENNNNEISINELPTDVAVKQVENMKFFPGIKKSLDNEILTYTTTLDETLTENEVAEIRTEIKEHIMKYGGISSVMNFSNTYFNTKTAAYNNKSITYTNHVVTIIGWDDKYSRENFKYKPNSDGAYIVLNSWGDSWGDNGVFYVSYEDLLIEGYLGGINEASDIDYDNVYQHDTSLLSTYFYAQYGANRFTSNQDEKLTEIMVGFLSNQTCNIYVSIGEELPNLNDIEPVLTNVKVQPGYNTVKLSKPIEIKKGDQFYIIVDICDYSGIGVAIECSKYDYPSVVSHEEESYVSSNGTNWIDVYNTSYYSNLSIKAFTQSDEKKIEVGDLAGRIYNDGTGEIKFNLLTSYVENGNNIVIQIVYSHTNKEVTDSFEISGNEVRGKGAIVTFKPMNKIKGGKYLVNIKLSEFETITKEFVVTNETETIIEVIERPEKTLYFLDQDINLVGGKIIEISPNETIKEINMTDENISVTKYMESNSFNGEIEINYNEEKTSFKVIVPKEEDVIASISIDKLPKKLEYIKGEELDLTGLVLDANYIIVYNNEEEWYRKGSEEEEEGSNTIVKLSQEIPVENLSISGFVSNELGKQDISIKYLNLESKFGITVRNDVSRIEIKENPSKLVYIKGEKLDLSGGILNIIYEDGSIEELEMLSNEIEVTGYNSNLLGRQEIILSYNKKEIKLNVTVKNDITGVEIKKSPNKLIYIKGEELDLTGGILNVIYEDKSVIELDMASINMSASGYNPESLGEQEVTLIYNEKVVKFNVIVRNDVIGIEIKENPTKTVYIKGEQLDLSGGIILVSFEDGSISEISMTFSRITTAGFNSNVLGEQEVIIEYQDNTAKFKIIVKNDIARIEVKKNPDKLVYIKGEELDLTGGILNLIYEDKTIEEIEMTSEEIGITGYNSNWLGDETITIKYKEKEAQFVIHIDSEKLESKIYSIDENYISKIVQNTKISEFKNNILGKIENYKILENNKEVTDENSLIKTGQELIINDEKYTLIVTGDLNGDGKIRASDLSLLKRQLIGLENLSDIFKKAADINEDGKIKTSDISALKRLIIGKTL